MHFVLKASVSIALTVLIISSAYLIVFARDDINPNNVNGNENKDFDDNDNETDSDNNSEEEKDFTHWVFIEAGTTVCCKACADVHIFLDEYYESGEYPFYYVSIPIENEKAAEYLANYNILGYPTIYFDGGYEVLSGINNWETLFKEKISSAVSRDVSRILVNVTGVWKENDNGIEINVFLENYEESAYSGRLRVYLTEIVSTKWQGDQPYNYAFIDFAINKAIEIPSNDNLMISKSISISDFDPENLMIFAVVFNSEKQVGYSSPPDQKPFDAYYADAAASTEIVKGGNLPPMVGILSPTIGYVHRFGNAKRVSQQGKTILLGRTTIIADATDDSSIEKVEFYINGKLMETKTEEPYEWKWHRFTIGKKTITVIAYDEEGKTSSANMEVTALIKWKNPILKLFEILQ
jgi:hypothetical protein